MITAIAYSATYHAANETTLSNVYVNRFLRCHRRSPTFISRFVSLANILSLSPSPSLFVCLCLSHFLPYSMYVSDIIVRHSETMV